MCVGPPLLFLAGFCVYTSVFSKLELVGYWFVPVILRAYGNGDNSNLGRPVPDHQARGSRLRVGRDWELLVTDRRLANSGSRSRAQTEVHDGSGVHGFGAPRKAPFI